MCTFLLISRCFSLRFYRLVVHRKTEPVPPIHYLIVFIQSPGASDFELLTDIIVHFLSPSAYSLYLFVVIIFAGHSLADCKFFLKMSANVFFTIKLFPSFLKIVYSSLIKSHFHKVKSKLNK